MKKLHKRQTKTHKLHENTLMLLEMKVHGHLTHHSDHIILIVIMTVHLNEVLHRESALSASASSPSQKPTSWEARFSSGSNPDSLSGDNEGLLTGELHFREESSSSCASTFSSCSIFSSSCSSLVSVSPSSSSSDRLCSVMSSEEITVSVVEETGDISSSELGFSVEADLWQILLGSVTGAELKIENGLLLSLSETLLRIFGRSDWSELLDTVSPSGGHFGRMGLMPLPSVDPHIWVALSSPSDCGGQDILSRPVSSGFSTLSELAWVRVSKVAASMLTFTNGDSSTVGQDVVFWVESFTCSSAPSPRTSQSSLWGRWPKPSS